MNAPRRPQRRNAVIDDIPEARRSLPVAPRNSRWRLGALLATGLLLAASLALAGTWRGWFGSPPVPGLAARLSSDGRLLGHFPYRQTPEDTLVSIGPPHRLHRDAAASLLAMQQAAKAEGVDLAVLSAFRSITLQRHLFFDVKSERAQNARQRAHVSAPPGFSEHSTGYAVDLGDAGDPTANLSEAFEGTSAFAWLQQNAARFHFELSFPRGNPQGVSYEPWHWRFEGTAEALKVFEPANRLER